MLFDQHQAIGDGALNKNLPPQMPPYSLRTIQGWAILRATFVFLASRIVAVLVWVWVVAMLS
jgi:hypothetical protein